MYLWEIPKTDNILISFDMADRHFGFASKVLPIDAKEDNGIYTEPVTVSDINLHLDHRCKNMSVRYLNQISGRTHIWAKDIEISYEGTGSGRYLIKCERDSVPENRRGAIRIPIEKKSDCIISLIEGKYPCEIHDVSVTGVGINIDLAIAEKHLLHRLVYTYFDDEVLNKSFHIKARVMHVTPLNKKIMRCGCEIIAVSPSINEYINVKQTHKLAKTTIYDEIQKQ